MKKFQSKIFRLIGLVLCCTFLSSVTAGPRGGGGSNRGGSRGGGNSRMSSSGGFHSSGRTSGPSSARATSSARTSSASLAHWQEKRQNFVTSQRGSLTRPSPTSVNTARTRPTTSNIVPQASARTVRANQKAATRVSRTHPRSEKNRYYGRSRYHRGYWGWPYYNRYFWYVGSPCWADSWIFWYPRSCFFYGYPYYPMVSINLNSDNYDAGDNSSREDRSESKPRNNRYPVLVQTMKIEDNPVVMIQLPAVNQSQYHKEHGNYGGYYALYAASKLQRTNPTSFSETVVALSQTQGKLLSMTKKSGLMDRSQFGGFLKKAVDIANQFDDQDKNRLKLQLRKFAAPSEEQLQAVAGNIKELSKVTIGYSSLPQDIKQVADLIANMAKSAEENEKPQFYCLTSRRGSDDWVAVRIEKKRGVTYATIVDAMGASRIIPTADSNSGE